MGLSVVATIVRTSKSYYGCLLTNKERRKKGYTISFDKLYLQVCGCVCLMLFVVVDGCVTPFIKWL